MYGTWEASSVSGQHAGPAHEGKSRTMSMHADEESDSRIVPKKPRTMSSNIGGGDGGGKAAGQGEGPLRRMLRTQRRDPHVTEAACSRIGATWVPNTPNTDHVRPETGAGCGKAACPDLHGGRGAILVPTVTLSSAFVLRRKCKQVPPTSQCKSQCGINNSLASL